MAVPLFFCENLFLLFYKRKKLAPQSSPEALPLRIVPIGLISMYNIGSFGV